MTTNRPPACDHAYKNFKPLDKRPARGGYAQGEYLVKCRKCECGFTGDKRSYECADCAYAGSNRPPSCDLPPDHYQPKLKPCPMCGFSGTEVIEGTIDLQGYCPACQMQGPDRATEVYAIQSWNAIPRRSEVMELLNKLEFAMLTSDWNRQDELEDLQRCATKLRKEMGE